MAEPRVADFLLGDDGDLVIRNGDFAFSADVAGIRQQIQLVLGFYLGEWFLDEEIGIPYYERILIKNPSRVEIAGYIREALLSVRGVLEVVSLDVQYSGSRIGTIDWKVTTDLGELAGTETVEQRIGA